MADHRPPYKDQVTARLSATATRSSRSSTLPSNQVSPPLQKQQHKHKHHQSTSHKARHGQRFSMDDTRQSNSLHNHTLSPLGEFLGPVKRNVADGLSGVAGWIEKDREKDRSRNASRVNLLDIKSHIAEKVEITATQVDKARQKRLGAERLVLEQYNHIARQTLEQHTALAESRSNMLRTSGRLDSTLASLSVLQTQTENLFKTLIEESIPELTHESTKQLETLQNTVATMQSKRIGGLQARVNTARQNTTNLGERMAQIRSQIQVWEEREIEENHRRRRKVGFVWGTIGIFFLLILLLLIWGRVNEQLEAREEQSQNWTQIVLEKERQRVHNNDTIVVIEELIRSLDEDKKKLPAPSREEPASEQEDDRLSSIFDEL